MNKDQLDKFSQPMVNVYNNLEKQMLINLASKLAEKKNLLAEDPEIWLMHQLQILGMLDKDNLNRIKIMAGLTSNQLNQLMFDAGLEGLSQDEEFIKKAVKNGAHLKVPPPITESPQIMKILQAYSSQAANVLNMVNQTMLINAKQMYTDTLNRVVLDVTSGFKTHDEALRDAVTQWAEKGIPALIDKGGKKWGVEGYVRTVIISSVNNNVNAMQDQRMKEWGIDLIEISSHSGARPLCAKFQGRIFSISGTHPTYPPFSSTSFGKPAGLFGINCGHRKYPFIEGVNTPTYKPYSPLKNAKVYKESQKQRAHERGIRKAKTQYEMHKAAGDLKGMDEASALIKNRQSNLRDFINETGRTRRRDREQIHINKDPKLPQTTVNPDPGIPKPKKKTTGDIKTPKKDMKPVVDQVIPAPEPPKVIPDPVKPTNPVVDINSLSKGDKIKFMHKDQVGEGEILNVGLKYVDVSTGDSFDKIKKTNIISHTPAKTADEYKVKHKESKWQSADGTIRSKDEVFAVKGKEETLIGEVKMTEFDIYKYYAVEMDGTKTVFNTQKGAKKYLLDKHLAEKGIAPKPKPPMQPTKPAVTTPDPIVEPPKEVKLKLMDDVTYKHKGKEVQGKIIDIDKKTGDIEVLTPDKKVVKVTKESIVGPADKKAVKKPAPTSKKALDPKPPAPKPVEKPKPVATTQTKNKITEPKKNIQDLKVNDKIKFTDKDGNELPGTIQKKFQSGNIYVMDDYGTLHQITKDNIIEHVPKTIEARVLSTFKSIGKDHKDVKHDAETLAKMNPSDKHWVVKYTSNYYSEMNSYLRKGKNDNNDVRTAVDNLKRVLSSNAKGLSQDTLLFRRIGQEAIRNIFNDEIYQALTNAAYDKSYLEKAKSMMVGGAMEDKAFVSTTHVEGSFGSSHDINIHIHCPAGYKGGMFVDSVSAFKGENEYILNAGKKLNILDIRVENKRIFLDVMPDDI